MSIQFGPSENVDSNTFDVTYSLTTDTGGYTTYTQVTNCSLLGHEVDEWAEYLDGVCAGRCARCNARVTAKRPPGGLPFLRLKAVVEQILAGVDPIALAMDVGEIASLLAAEQRALDDANALLATARRMVGCQD